MKQTLVPLDKSARMGTGVKTLIWIVGVVIVIGIVIGLYSMISVPPEEENGLPPGIVCPSDLTWSGTVDVINKLNLSAVESYDTTAYIYNAGTDTLKTSITDTTAGAATLTCGQEYDIRILSTSGAAGDSARILAVSEGTVNGDGTMTFLAQGDGNRITLDMNQHGVPEIRCYDAINSDWIDQADDGAATGTSYSTTDGVNFTSITDNATATAIGASGEFHVILYVRANVVDENFNDLGTYVLMDLAPATWQLPTVKIDGTVVSNIKGTLGPNAAIAYADYEYVYLIDKDNLITKTSEVAVDVSVFAVAGQDPAGAQAPIIDFSVIGRYASSAQSNVLKVGAVDDSTSRTQVYGLHDTNFFIS